MPDQPPVRLVDSRGSAFVSFAPPDPAALGSRGRTPARTPIAVGPGRASIAEPNRDSADVGFGVTYPIQAGKIQPPNLRDETLARTRLLDWLDVKIHRRLVFVIADAGYGKTTLLADFSRRTRLRTIWYRLDEEDRDWVGFLAHLVAAGREHDPGFAPRTASILRSLEPGGPTREDAIEAFIDELPAIAIDGAALILDDFHLADEVADIRLIAREIVARGPERLSIVFASRRPPSIPVSKWRTMGELAELGIADLRFSDTEMEQLFRETFGRPLEPDVLAELARRTEGWAASLTLVQAALRERTPAETRSFVRGLSGARDELHDYLAEEVVGDLPVVQQQFLMRTSLLQRVTPELAQVATDLEASEVQSMITEAERLGLLGRRAKRRSAEQRYHPLVREFLEDRLRREIGPTGVDELHVKIARWAEPNDWRTAAYHYAAARELEQLSVVLDVHLGTIVGSGAFTAAGDYLGELGSSSRSFASEVIRSRLASLAGDANQAMHHATTALNINPVAELALSNLAASAILAGEIPIAIDLARQLAESATGEDQRAIGIALQLMFEASLEGDLIYISRHLEEMAETNRIRGHTHYEGVSLLNASLTHRARGNVEEALRDASRAVDSLRESSSGSELASALFSLAWPFAWAGDLDRARETMQSPSTFVAHASKSELSYEQAALESELGSVDAATVALSAFDRSVPPTPYVEIVKATRVLLSIRLGEFDAAVSVARSIDPDIASAEPGRRTKVLALMSLVSAMTRSPDRQRLADRAIELADRQGANVYGVVARLARADDSASIASVIVATPERLRPALGIGAELIVSHLEHLPDQARDVIRDAALQHPVRWRDALRFALARGAESERGFAAGRLLEQIGTLEDVPVLRALARRSKSPSDRALGRDLARRLSPRVVVRDLGPMRIEVGPVVLSAGSVRRKVLSLLCFLLTRPQMSANREEVMDALWPEMDPAGASNSLNQTIYFLRRVIEPQYDDETSPGYVRQESDLVYLDPDLIDSTSRHAARLIGRIDQGETHLVDDLSRTYTDRFAADFAYEDWAVDYREWLHVSYLQIVERAIATGIEAGQFEKTLPIARRALETEPRLESLLLSLLKLLKGAGAHAAAAEQYERYATILRHDIGVDPPPFEAV